VAVAMFMGGTRHQAERARTVGAVSPLKPALPPPRPARSNAVNLDGHRRALNKAPGEAGMTTSIYMLIALIIASGSSLGRWHLWNYARPQQTSRPRPAVWRIACQCPLPMPAPAVPRAIAGKRDALAAPLGPRRRSNSSIVLSLVISRS
jgi:hypothetical protein